MNCRFFDHNATTPLSGAAREAWLEAVEGAWLNPSSPNRAAAAVKVKVEAAREALAARFDVAAERVVFNSGATEGNNTVFAYWARVFPAEAKVAVSPTEHPSVIEAAKFHFDGRLIWLALDAVGAVDVAALDRLLESEQGIAAVSVMAANNETGILNDWQAIAACCRQRHLAYHCDASQWVGKLPLEGFAA
ncbi:MAG: aminotransferase class V-fold PLP-dependent enzyme, partial [Verrucomicrobiota bacterium]